MTHQIIQTKQCVNCGSAFDITNKDLIFYDKFSPIIAGEKFSIPTPNHCPDCRQQRRMAWRNERKLYKRKCDITGNVMISIYPPNAPYKVIGQKNWRSNQNNPMDYGMDFDFSRNFFDQFGELFDKIPKMNLLAINNENSSYVNMSWYLKDCYLVFECGYDENCMYSNTLYRAKYCIDCSVMREGGSNCYENIDGRNNFKVFFAQDSYNCNNCYFIKNCINCEFCFGCVNLHNQKYHIFNKEYTREEYLEEIKKYNLKSKKSLDKIKEDFKNFQIKSPNKYLEIINCENCYGNHLIGCKNCYSVFDALNAEDVRYAYSLDDDIKDSMDISNCANGTHLFEGTSVNGYRVIFSRVVANSERCIYCNTCFNCTNCFGCVGLRNKKYCIFNKQYTREEYEKLVPQIIKHMQKTMERGEFFPIEMSPFPYNDTVAQEYYPINKTKAIEYGYKWADREELINVSKGFDNSEEIPDNINDVTDDILKKTITCKETGKSFRIVRQELEFYRKYGLPLPDKNYNIRHAERIAKRTPRKLIKRVCDKCGEKIHTTYDVDRPEVVYCEECYNDHIYK